MSADLAFRMQVFIAATAEKIWGVRTDSERAKDWWDPVIRADWRSGGRVVYGVGEKFKIDCDILEMDPPRRLVTTFDCDAYPEHPPTRVTWEIEPVEGGCLLRMIHDRFPSTDLGLADVSRHWPGIIGALVRVIEER